MGWLSHCCFGFERLILIKTVKLNQFWVKTGHKMWSFEVGDFDIVTEKSKGTIWACTDSPWYGVWLILDSTRGFKSQNEFFESAKMWGPTEIRTRIVGFKVQSDSHYTIRPCFKIAISYIYSTSQIWFKESFKKVGQLKFHAQKLALTI